MKKLLTLSFAMVFCIVTINGQTKLNKLNQYTDLGEKYWLKKHGIDLFKKEITDKTFHLSVKKLLALKQEEGHNKSWAYTYSIAGTFLLITGILIPSSRSVTTVNSGGTGVVVTKRSQMLEKSILIAAGGVGFAYAIPFHKRFKKAKEAKEKEIDNILNLMTGF